MNRKPNILLLTPFFHPNIGGVETHLNDLCEYLVKNKYTTYVLTYFPLTTRTKNVSRTEKSECLEIYRFKLFGHDLFHRLEKYPPLALLYLMPILFVRTFLFLLSPKHQVDIIHAQGIVAALIGRLLGKLFNKRMIMSTHAMYSLEKRKTMSAVFHWILKPYDRIIALTKGSKRELMSTGLPDEQIDIYYYWVNKDVFKPGDKAVSKKTVGWKEKFVVLFVGRLIEIKGVRLLLDVAGALEKNIHIAISGTGPLEKVLREESQKLENLLFLGPIDNIRLNEYYRAADIFIIPSLYPEGLGRVCLEALYCGTPIIASNRGNLPEVVDPSVGVLIEPTVENMVSEIKRLYENADQLEQLGNNCAQYARDKFGENNANTIQKAYSPD